MDKLELQKQEDMALKKQLEKVDWPFTFGIISVQLRDGKLAIVKLERTIKCD